MSKQNIGDHLKKNVHAVLTGGSITEDIMKYVNIDEADKRRKVVTKKADNHVMPELTNVYTNNKTEKKLLEDIAVFLNHLEAKHQESNVKKRNKDMNGSRKVAVNMNKDAAASTDAAAAATTTTTATAPLQGGVTNKVLLPKGGSGRMYNKCRKLEDEFSGIF